jgi:hypothetical protein
VAIASALLVAAAAIPARASTAEFLETLSGSQREEFQAVKAAKSRHDRAMDAYWQEVDRLRSGRKKKRKAGIAFTEADYMPSFPPKYTGPELSPALEKAWAKFQAEQEKIKPKPPPKELPRVEDYLRMAKDNYGFVPERVSEKEFKRRYAREAVQLGLSKTQVVRVYALETGGNGTADMQAGIHPIKKTGRPVSSALGYAQLLDANSVDELSKHGEDFIARLNRMASGADAQRRARLQGKVAAIKKMLKNVRRVPKSWDAYVAYANTPKGMGIHVLNLDGDVGPMLQSIKLKGILDEARSAGRSNLTGAELEIMNLSGPRTGLEMMTPIGRRMPVTNFFARRAYYVNKMVIGLDGAGLLAELDRRMDNSIKQPGAQEFLEAFDGLKSAAVDEQLPWQ